MKDTKKPSELTDREILERTLHNSRAAAASASWVKNYIVGASIIALILWIVGTLTGCASKTDASSPPLAAPITTVEKVLLETQKQFGPFSEVRYKDDSLTSIHEYKGRAMAITKRLKGLIDKTTNSVGVQYVSKYGPEPNAIGEWTWESPTEKIWMKGFATPQDTAGSVIMTVERK